MKKHIFIFIAFLTISSSLSAQKTFYTKSGYIGFFSTTPLENIEARNNQVVSFIKTDKGAVSFGLLVKSFKFKNALMEEHFNENYAETDKFPKAKFKGTITNLSDIDFGKNGTYDANVSGKIKFHGVSKEVSIKAKLSIDGENLKAGSTFYLKPSDFDIKIPSVVREKIAKEMTVKVDVEYKIYKK